MAFVLRRPDIQNFYRTYSVFFLFFLFFLLTPVLWGQLPNDGTGNSPPVPIPPDSAFLDQTSSTTNPVPLSGQGNLPGAAGGQKDNDPDSGGDPATDNPRQEDGNQNSGRTPIADDSPVTQQPPRNSDPLSDQSGAKTKPSDGFRVSDNSTEAENGGLGDRQREPGGGETFSENEDGFWENRLNRSVVASDVPTLNTEAASSDGRRSSPLLRELPVKIVRQVMYSYNTTLFELSNGLVVFVRHTDSSTGAVCVYVQNTGSVFENEFLGSGISHLTEKLIADGRTFQRSAAEIQTVKQRLGGLAGSLTERDQTKFFITCPSDSLISAIELLADQMQNMTFDSNDLTSRMLQIRQEMITQDNDQETQTQELLLRTLYMYHPCRHPVLGYQDLFLRLTAADVKNFYNTRYVPNNQIYVVTGCIDPGLVIQTLMNAYQNSGRGKDLAISLPIEPQQISPRESGQEQERETVRLVYAWPTVSRSHPDSFALDLLATILTGGADGILTQKTQWEKPLTTDISAQSLSFRFTNGFFKIEATTLPENLVALENVIQQTIDQLKTQPITEQRLARAKKILEMNFLFHSQDINEVMDRMVRNYLMTGDPNFDSEYLAKINKVSLGDVQQAFQKYLPGNTRNRVVILPIGMLPVQIASQPVPAEKPKHKVFNFNNGLRVIVYSADQSLNLLMNQDPGSLPADLPSIVNLQFTVLGNTLVDDDTNTGRAAVLAEMLGRETNSLKSKDIQQYFDSIGASLEFAVGRNTIYAGMTLLQDDLDKSLDYLTECVTHPVFTEEELARAKKRVITRIRKRGDTPLGQLMEQFIQTVPRNSPYHLHQDGTVASVESLTLKDIQNYYNMLFVPQNTIITVAGDKNPAKTMARINQLFESVPKSGVFQPISFDRKNDLLEPLKTHKRVETETGLALVAFPAPAMTEIKDYAAMTVFQAILGNLGTSNGRLYDRLQRTGMVYRVGVEQTQGPVPGYFYILLETDPNQLRLVLEQLMQILHQIKTGDITEQEFLLARQQVIARQRMQNPTLQEQARRFTLLTLYRISPDFDSELIEIIQNMKPDDVLEAVHKYLQNSIQITVSPNP